MNVEVLHGSSRLIPVRMKFGKHLQLGQSIVVDLAAVLTNTPQQSLTRCAERSVLPPRVLFAGVAFSSLQDPLQRAIHDPPTLVELGYEPICGVRGRERDVDKDRGRECRYTRLAHPVFSRMLEGVEVPRNHLGGVNWLGHSLQKT